ncbi:MAG: hypothetical protein HY289_06465 [Planctomycetes bacterium]|nr:hypothetical protein [Planctomycetota bacterium]
MKILYGIFAGGFLGAAVGGVLRYLFIWYFVPFPRYDLENFVVPVAFGTLVGMILVFGLTRPRE